MESKRRSRSAALAALLASTAIIALLTGCQTTSGSGSSIPSTAVSPGFGGYAW